jgi:hypothetical protein
MDDVCQARDDWLTWAGEPAAEIIPESHAQLGAGLGQTKEGIAAVATDVAAGATADFAFGHLTAMSFSEPFVCNGMCGWSSTANNSV